MTLAHLDPWVLQALKGCLVTLALPVCPPQVLHLHTSANSSQISKKVYFLWEKFLENLEQKMNKVDENKCIFVCN